MSHIPQDAARRLVDRLGAAAPHPPDEGPDSDLYSRLESLSKVMESSGRIDEHDHPDAYGAILDAMRFVAAAPHPPATQEPPMHAWSSQAALDVLAERRRQIEREGWTPDHDDEHDAGELAAAGSAYALAAADALYPLSQSDGGFDAGSPPDCWPLSWTFKPAEPRRMLVKAAALLLAEIERLDRAAPHAEPPKEGA